MSGKRGSLQLQNRKTSFRSTLSCERKKAEREDIIVTFMKEKEKGTIGIKNSRRRILMRHLGRRLQNHHM